MTASSNTLHNEIPADLEAVIDALVQHPVYPKVLFVSKGKIVAGIGEILGHEPTSTKDAGNFFGGMLSKVHSITKEEFDTKGSANGQAGVSPKMFMIFPFDFKVGRESIWKNTPSSKVFVPSLMIEFEDGLCQLATFKGEGQKEAFEMFIELLRKEKQQNSKKGDIIFEDVPSYHYWKKSVQEVLDEIEQQQMKKIVLSRTRHATLTGKIDLTRTILQLTKNNENSTTFLMATDETSVFFGSTPELLGRKRGNLFKTMALAGTVRSAKKAEEEEDLKKELFESEKLREEHEIVVTTIQDELQELCEKIEIGNMEVVSLKNVMHLHTPIKGVLKDKIKWWHVFERIHPTPAVGGLPKNVAIKQIRKIEHWGRGWYSGVIGWADMKGNADLFVSLRCGLLKGKDLWIFAGAGIVEGSDALAEWQETALKFQSIENSLFLENEYETL